MRSFCFINRRKRPIRTSVLGLTQPLTEMSTSNLPGVKCGRCVRLKTSQSSVSRLPGKCGSLEVSQPHELLLPATGKALLVIIL
jgi:hypothetical protein